MSLDSQVATCNSVKRNEKHLACILSDTVNHQTLITTDVDRWRGRLMEDTEKGTKNVKIIQF